jgi:HD-GYP domain-containing protein (c-di-GMP phosphodiesterase class II)
MSHDEAVMELHRNIGGQFDPQVVNAFIGTFRLSNTVAFPALAFPLQKQQRD